MEISRESGKIILKYNSEVVEEYNFKDNIDLKKLIGLLLSDNLASKFTLEDKLDNKSTEEENLVSVIKGLIDDYNNKTKEYEAFVAEEKAT